MRREHDRRRIEGGHDVRAAAIEPLLDNRVSQRPELSREPRAGFRFAPGRRININERTRESDRVERQFHTLVIGDGF
jgi:hypothetical protein